jgi:RNase P subunit RPR2
MDACVCDYDPPEFVSQSMRRARKPHTCEECSRVIEPGEHYEYTFGKWDGDVSRFRVCARCLEVRRFITDSIPCFCWAYGNLHEDAKETARHYASEAPGLLFGTYRRIILANRRALQKASQP